MFFKKPRHLLVSRENNLLQFSVYLEQHHASSANEIDYQNKIFPPEINGQDDTFALYLLLHDTYSQSCIPSHFIDQFFRSTI